MKYAIYLPKNDSLERDIAELLPRPVGRPSKKPLVKYQGFLYQAASWKAARRVVTIVGPHVEGVLPRVSFIMTNLTLRRRAVVRFHNIGGPPRSGSTKPSKR